MYVVLLKYLKPIEVVETVVAEHRAYLNPFYDSGDFLCSGPQNPRVGGLILARTRDRARLESILRNDPFHLAGVADFEIIEFTPVKHAPGFEAYL